MNSEALPQAAAEAAAPPPPPTFDALALSPDIRQAVDALGYTNPTPVQLAVFEPASRGKNLVVQARTGTGKTAAFGLPILDALVKKSVPGVQALILTPTRELALQVAAELERLGKFRETRVTAIYGGAPMGKQIQALEEGAQVVAGTPGRVLDHLRRGTLDPSAIRVFVLDEADEMLSMGFAKELNAIIDHLPKERQGLYFSATIPPDVERLATSHLRDPEYVTLSSDQVGALEINHFTYLVREGDKRGALVRIVEVEDPESAIVFCNTREETERVCEALNARGYDADWLNGDLDQRERETVMAKTREGKLRFLVATDVAARGIDISHLTHVINADFPESAEYYVHRTGRTGRAGKTGTAISVVTPKDIGHLYMLRLTYKIRPVERSLPTQGELRTRAETDLVAFLADAYAGRKFDDVDLAVARRLLTHENAVQLIAGLLRDHLGEKATPAAQEDAGEARRGKNPPPMPKEPKPRATDKPRAAAADEDEPETQRRAPREGRRDGRGRTPREDRAPRAPGGARDARAQAADAPAAGPRAEATADATPTAPTRRGRGRVPHTSYAEWEPTPEGDDDTPLFSVEGEPPEARRARAAARGRRDDDSQASVATDPRPARTGDAEPAHDDVGFARIFLNVGRRDGLRRDDLLKMLQDLASIAETETGKIQVRDRMTFFSVKEEHAERAIQALAGQVVRGRSVVAEPAKER